MLYKCWITFLPFILRGWFLRQLLCKHLGYFIIICIRSCYVMIFRDFLSTYASIAICKKLWLPDYRRLYVSVMSWNRELERVELHSYMCSLCAGKGLPVRSAQSSRCIAWHRANIASHFFIWLVLFKSYFCSFTYYFLGRQGSGRGGEVRSLRH